MTQARLRVVRRLGPLRPPALPPRLREPRLVLRRRQGQAARLRVLAGAVPEALLDGGGEGTPLRRGAPVQPAGLQVLPR